MELRKLLQEMYYAKNLLLAEHRTAFTDEELQWYIKPYDRIVAEGLTANPLLERKLGNEGG